MNVQKTLIVLGLGILVVGLLWPVISKIPLGRLPGDIVINKPGFSFYFPITTMVVISVVLSLIAWFFHK